MVRIQHESSSHLRCWAVYALLYVQPNLTLDFGTSSKEQPTSRSQQQPPAVLHSVVFQQRRLGYRVAAVGLGSLGFGERDLKVSGSRAKGAFVEGMEARGRF